MLPVVYVATTDACVVDVDEDIVRVEDRNGSVFESDGMSFLEDEGGILS
jgi:hypothetical protein